MLIWQRIELTTASLFLSNNYSQSSIRTQLDLYSSKLCLYELLE